MKNSFAKSIGCLLLLVFSQAPHCKAVVKAPVHNIKKSQAVKSIRSLKKSTPKLSTQSSPKNSKPVAIAKTHPKSHAKTTQVNNIRIWPSPQSTRVVFDLNKEADYQIKTLLNPDRICIEIKNAELQLDPKTLLLENSRIKSIQSTIVNNQDLQLNIELIHSLKPTAFSLEPNQQYGHRLVLDLDMGQNEKDAILALFEADGLEIRPGEVSSDENSIDLKAPPALLPRNTAIGRLEPASNADTVSPEPVKTWVRKKGPFIIAIDPGHGGEDPGAVGKRGTKEKDVVLAISRHLKSMIEREPNMRAVLTRNGDYYVALHERVNHARKHRADLFISIHADAFHDMRANGASVFTLSERGASSAAARWIAAKENRSDLIGGVRLSDKNKVLASVLLDLSQTKSKEEGYKAAKYVLTSVGKIEPLHRGMVEHAGFAVLKAPDIPSLLIETGFISNLRGEARLRTSEHQRKVAKSILEGIRRYAAQRTH